MTSSALDSSATNGGPSCGRQLCCLFGLVLSIALCIRTIHRLRRLNEEKRMKRSGSSIPGESSRILTSLILLVSVDAESFLTSTSDGSKV